jgi:hypothetical protein
MAMDERERRLGVNEVLFREVNERLADMREPAVQAEGRFDFICECANRDCDARVAMTVSEYEAVRAEPTYFVIHPGHQLAEIETVVRQTDRFAVVQKRAGEAAELAVEHDPRS